MKILKKSDIIENKLVGNIQLEKKILQKSNNPFLVKLKYAFQTDLKIYLVMEYCQGGELYNCIKKFKFFPEQVVRFYAGQVLLGLEYLHNDLNITYRDLKPENILLTQQGNIKITDFGLATKTKKSYTFAGTPEYLAPEIIQAKGHNKMVDIWSLGVLIFEMSTGYPPFTDKDRHIPTIERLILENNPKYPSSLSNELKSLISSLLQSDPEKRLSIVNIKQHPFFSSMNWQDLFNQKIKPPYENTVASYMRQIKQTGAITETYEEKQMHIEGITFDQNQQSLMPSQFNK